MYATLSRSIMLDFIEEEDKYRTLNAQPHQDCSKAL